MEWTIFRSLLPHSRRTGSELKSAHFAHVSPAAEDAEVSMAYSLKLSISAKVYSAHGYDALTFLARALKANTD